MLISGRAVFSVVAVAVAVLATSLVWLIVMRRQIQVHLREREHLEEGLRQAQKMESVGRLAGGIAHDFNNLLTVVIGYSEVVASLGRDNPEIQQAIGEIQRAAERATTLTRQLLAFGRRQRLAPATVDLNDVARDMSRMLERLLGGEIELVTQLPADPVRVVVDRNQMEQAVLNMAVNSRDAMPKGGRLTIRTATERVQGDGVDVTAGEYGVITIEDTGTGMSPEVQRHVFDPFFSTKDVGQGTGLGLSMVYGFVKQSGGHIRLRSAPGQGASFDLSFPIA